MSDMPQKRLFCFGYGYTSAMLVAAMKAQPKAQWSFAGTTRDAEKMQDLRSLGIKAFLMPENRGLADPFAMLAGVTHILITTPPDDEGCPVFRLHGHDIAQLPDVEWVGYLSATSVYGNRDGGWVDETSETRPISKRGSRRLLAEQQWQSLARNDGLPVHIFRLAGIYGPGQSGLDAVRAGRARRIKKEGHAFNRIHIEDIVQVLLASMSKPDPGAVYNVSDDNPAGSWEVITHAGELLDIELLPMMPYDDADLAPITRSFYADNKRVKNDKIKNELGVTLKYPSYKEGLERCLEVERAAQDPVMTAAGLSIVSGDADDIGGS